MLSEVYLGLGSNLNDKIGNIRNAVGILSQISDGILMSSIYETTPRGFGSQPSFLNAVCKIWTKLDPYQLMDALINIETSFGHERPFINSPRVLDIDILLFGGLVLTSPRLTVPHPAMVHRGFVLIPLVEIAPAVIHPGLNLLASALLDRLDIAQFNEVRRLVPNLDQHSIDR